MIDVKTAKTSELVAFYNEHAKSQIKKFSDRATAERRVADLLVEVESKKAEQTEKDAEVFERMMEATKNPNRSEAIAASWNDDKVKEARSMRNGVFVDGTTEYRSVKAAFIQLGLPLGKHIKFRMNLKAAGTLEFQGHEFVLID